MQHTANGNHVVQAGFDYTARGTSSTPAPDVESAISTSTSTDNADNDAIVGIFGAPNSRSLQVKTRNVRTPSAVSSPIHDVKHDAAIRRVGYDTNSQPTGGVRHAAATAGASRPVMVADVQNQPQLRENLPTAIEKSVTTVKTNALVAISKDKLVVPLLNDVFDRPAPRVKLSQHPFEVVHSLPAKPDVNQEVAVLQIPQQERVNSDNFPSPGVERQPPMESSTATIQTPQEVPESPASNRVIDAARTYFGSPVNSPNNVPKPAELPSGIDDDDLPPVQLHVDDMDVRKVLEMLSRQGKLNILVSPGVSGNITANLENVRFNEALQAILRLANLVSVPEGNMLYVYTPDEYSRVNSGVREISSRIYKLQYLRASDIETMIAPFLSEDHGRLSVTPAADVGIKSDTDLVGGDSLAGAETIVVQDYESVLQRIDQIIEELDVEPTQVVIEAVIMEVVLDDTMALGVNFALLNDAQSVLTVAGNGAALNAAGGFTPATLLSAGKLIDGFTQPNQGLKFGILEDNVSVFIDALEALTTTNVLASPRVMVLNKQRAELIIGERIGFKTLTVTQTSTVENIQFLNVGTQLRLRPFVTPDGMIRMEVHPERSTGDVVDGVPRTRTNEITTNVMIPNGSTIVLAGLIEEEDITTHSGVPGLSRVPYLGAMFRRESTTTRRKELVVTLTPRIVNPSTILAGGIDSQVMADMAASKQVLADVDQKLDFQTPQNKMTLHKVSPTIRLHQPKVVAESAGENGSGIE